MIVTCPNCSQKNRVADNARGKQVACGRCKTAIRVPGGPQADPWDDPGYASPPTQQRRRPPRKRKSKTPKIIGFIVAGVFGIGLIAAGIIAGVSWVNSRAKENGETKSETVTGKSKSGNGKSPNKQVIGDPNREYPSLPYAVASLPKEVTAGVPFDVDEFFREPPEDQNAAKLYLDALYEFSADMKECAHPDVNAARLDEIKSRDERLEKVWPRGAERPKPFAETNVEDLLKHYEGGFEKIRLAQQRPRCLFRCGMGPLAVQSYVLASSDVIRLIHLRIWLKGRRKQFDSAIDDLAMALRLCRDIQPRGESFHQLVVAGIDRMICTQIVPRLINSDLKTKHYDRLMTLMREHDRKSVNLMEVMVKTECLKLQKVLYDLENESGEFTPDRIREASAGNFQTRGDVFCMLALNDGSRKQEFDDRFARLSARDYKSMRKAVNEQTQVMLESLKVTDYRRTQSDMTAATGQLHRPWWVLLYSAPRYNIAHQAITIRQANINGAICQIAIRRKLMIDRKLSPVRILEFTCKAAGLTKVPEDPFLGPKSEMSYNKGYVYSVGPDIKDHKAELDWFLNKPRRGDIIIPQGFVKW